MRYFFVFFWNHCQVREANNYLKIGYFCRLTSPHASPHCDATGTHNKIGRGAPLKPFERPDDKHQGRHSI